MVTNEEPVMTFKDAKREIVDQFERRYLDTLLDRTAGNLSAAERTSGLSRKYLRELIRKHGMFQRVLQSRISSLLAVLGNQPEMP